MQSCVIRLASWPAGLDDRARTLFLALENHNTPNENSCLEAENQLWIESPPEMG